MNPRIVFSISVKNKADNFNSRGESSLDFFLFQGVCLCVCLWVCVVTNVSFCSVSKSCPALCDHMDCSVIGSFVLHYPQFAQIHVHCVSHTI